MRLARAFLLLSILASLASAQGPLAAGTYGLASSFGFSNSSSFSSITSSSLTATQAVFEVSDDSTLAIVSMILEDSFGHSARLSLSCNVGYTTDGSLTLSTEQCVTSENNFGGDLCSAARAANGCSRTYTWGQSTTDEPFANRTLILMDGFCGSNGVVAFTCGSVGGCNGVSSNVLALPLGDYELYGLVGAFVYDSPLSDAITLSNMSLTMLNNFEYVAIYNFLTSGNANIVVKTFAAVVPDQNANLLFSIYNCSQSQSQDVEVCALLENNGGCEVTVPDSQIDLDPPNNLTLIQLPLWCNLFGVTQLRCSTTCEGPINRGSSPATVGFDAGNCLAFSGNTLNVVPGGCELDTLVVNQLNVTNAYIDNQQITNQTILQQTVVEQTVIQQTIEQQTVIEQNVENINASEIDSIDIFTITFQATQENIDVSSIYNLTLSNIYNTAVKTWNGIQIPFYEKYFSSSVSFGWMETSGAYLDCGASYPPYAYPLVGQLFLARNGNIVTGTISPGAPWAGNCGVSPYLASCWWFGTLAANTVPPHFRPANGGTPDDASVVGVTPAFIVDPVAPVCACSLRLTVTANGRLLWMPYRPAGSATCCTDTGDYGFSAQVYALNSGFVGYFPDNSYAFTFSYNLYDIDDA